MLTVIGKVDRTALVPYDSLDVSQVAGDPLSKAHFTLVDPTRSIVLRSADEVILFDETRALTRLVSGVPVTDTAVPTHNYLDNNNFTYGSGGWAVSGTLGNSVSFPASPTFGAGSVATLSFANASVGTVAVAQACSRASAGPLAYIVAGQQYCVSLTLTVSTAFTNASCFVSMQFRDSLGAAVGAAITQTYTGVFGPARVSLTGTAPAGATDLLVSFGGTATSATNSGTATFTACMAEPMWFPALYSYPSPICDFLQPDCVTLPDGTTARYDRVFCGFITHLKVRYEGATRIYEVEATSTDWLMENATLVNATYSNATDQSILTGIVNGVSPKLIYAATPALATNTPQALAYQNVPIVYAGILVSALEFADATIREVANALSALSGFLFGVDAYYNLFYYPPFYNSAPYGFSSSPDGVTTFAYYDYAIEYDATQLQNAFNVCGGTFATTVTESWHFGDGTHSETVQAGNVVNVLLKHSPNAVPGTVSVGGTNLSCAQDTNAGYGTAQSIVTVAGGYGQPNLLSFPSPGYASGTAISVTYAYDTLAYATVRAPDSIAAYGRPLWGKVNDTTLVSNAAVVAAGEASVETYAAERVTMHLKCQYLVQPGQVVAITSAPDGISAQHFTINKVTARQLGAGVNEYEVEAGTYLDDFVDFFRNTQKALSRASHSPTAPLQVVALLSQDSISLSDSLTIHT